MIKRINVLTKIITIDEALQRFGSPESKILNVCSGQIKYGKHCVNIDKRKLPGVDVVTDAQKGLPIKSQSFDIVVVSASLNLFRDPFFLAKEINRVLKVGGLVICDAPFVMPYCGSASDPDYFRFSGDGLRFVFTGFKPIMLEPSINEGSSILFYLQAIAKSVFRRTKFETPFVNFITVFFYPLKWLRMHPKFDSPGAFLFVGKKCKKT